MNRIDLHNHLLFGIDDGATDAAESLALARALVQAGYSDVVTTPHAKPNMDPDRGLVAQRLVEVQALLDREGVALRLHLGAENHLTPEMIARSEAGDARPLAKGPWVLVELPFATIVPRLRETLFRLQLKGLKPVIAHPERCAQFVGRLDEARSLGDAGVHFQVEVGSLSGLYGGPAKKTAIAMLDEGLIHLAGTDAHHLRATQEILGAGMKALAKHLGPSGVERITEENPARVLRGEKALAL